MWLILMCPASSNFEILRLTVAVRILSYASSLLTDEPPLAGQMRSCVRGREPGLCAPSQYWFSCRNEKICDGKRTVKKIIFSISTSLLFSNVAFAQSLDVQSYLKQQGWTETIFKHRFSSPVPGIVPLVYFTKDGIGPNCVLIVESKKGPKMFDVSSAEQGESYLQCFGFNSAEQFQMNNRSFVVFEFLTRETKEDTFSRFYFLSKEKRWLLYGLWWTQ